MANPPFRLPALGLLTVRPPALFPPGSPTSTGHLYTILRATSFAHARPWRL